MKPRWTVYCYTSLVSGKRYVGRTTKSRELRWRGHCSKPCRYPFAQAIRELGQDEWSYEVLDVVTTRRGAKLTESAWISQLGTVVPNGYNVQPGDVQSVLPIPPKASLQTKWISCGKAGCKGCPHGPYIYAKWWESGRCVTSYVGKAS